MFPQGTLLRIPAVDRPSFLLLIHSGCTMLPQRRLDHSQIQRQSFSPGGYSNPLFHSHPPSHVRLAVLSLAQYYAHGLHRLVVVSPRHSFCLESSPTGGAEYLHRIQAQQYYPFISVCFNDCEEVRTHSKYHLRSSQTYRFRQIDKRGSFVPRPCRRSHLS